MAAYDPAMVAYTLDTTATRLTLKVTRGKAFRAQVGVTLQPSNEPVDIEADQVRAFVTLFPSGENVADLVVVPLDPPQPGTFWMYSDGRIDLPEGSYWWEMEWEPVTGPPMPMVEGVFEVCNMGRHA